MNSFRSLAGWLAPRRSTRPGRPAARTQHAERMAAALRSFRRGYPAYDSTAAIDELRAAEFDRLDRLGHVYLDYTGGSLYAESLLQAHAALLRGGVFGNPHSKNLTSLAMTELVERARARVLRFFNASPDEYVAIFTPNASGALRLVGEAYPFGAGDAYLLTADNHNSVNGIREFARAKGASISYVPLVAPELHADATALLRALEHGRPGGNNLLAFPAQSNFTGAQHPLAWVELAQARGWDVLLDAAAFVPTNRLDLGRVRPDFVDISFYKIFGYPTGIGCLLARRPALAKLRRPWYAGGTISFSSVAADGHHLAEGAAAFEDGTVNYLGIPAVEHGLDLVDSVGVETIHTRVTCLTAWLIDQLLALRHGNGRPLVRLYGPFGAGRRGPTVQVNFFDPDGRMHDCYALERLANEQMISLRAGCHCNPGAREAALGLTAADLEPCFPRNRRPSPEEAARLIEGKTAGALRASLGLASTFADVYAYAQFARSFLDRPAAA